MKAHDLFDLTGAVALVTGASSGLGERFARTLAANGARVGAIARRKDRLATLAGEIKAAGGQAIAIEADVTDRAAMAAAFEETRGAFGPVTILVNNAGIALPGRVTDQPDGEWRRTMDVNLDAVHANAVIAAREMIAAKSSGAIINIASILSFGVARGIGAYAVSKAAVHQLTRALALELGQNGIRVNAIAPGYVTTEMNADYLRGEKGAAMAREVPLGRFGDTSDLDGVLLLLASNAGRYITGATYVVDGGHALALRG
jgi:NAD(P)-dependent dehydrogenase (short-subunit alcohol dehydrogenase family)